MLLLVDVSLLPGCGDDSTAVALDAIMGATSNTRVRVASDLTRGLIDIFSIPDYRGHTLNHFFNYSSKEINIKH